MTTINATALKLGSPETLLRRVDHWLVLHWPARVMPGSLVLVYTGDATLFSALSPVAFTELTAPAGGIEHRFAVFQPCDRMNYVMLMMIDPDVHFHVIPRFAATQEFGGLAYPDAGWPEPPALGIAVTPDDGRRDLLLAAPASDWKG